MSCTLCERIEPVGAITSITIASLWIRLPRHNRCSPRTHSRRERAAKTTLLCSRCHSGSHSPDTSTKPIRSVVVTRQSIRSHSWSDGPSDPSLTTESTSARTEDAVCALVNLFVPRRVLQRRRCRRHLRRCLHLLPTRRRCRRRLPSLQVLRPHLQAIRRQACPRRCHRVCRFRRLYLLLLTLQHPRGVSGYPHQGAS